MMITLDELTYRAPAKLSVRLIALRARAKAWTEWHAEQIRTARRVAAAVVFWLAALALVLAYLVIAAYLGRADLDDRYQQANAEVARLQARNRELEGQLAEAAATRTQKLIYLVEAGSTKEAKDKLQHAAMLVAGAHFDLQEATREGPK